MMNHNDFYIPHAGELILENQGLLFCDTDKNDWQLLRINLPEAVHKRIHFRLTVELFVSHNKLLYINGFGGDIIAAVNSNGVVEYKNEFYGVNCESSLQNNFISIECEYDSIHGSLTFGLLEKRFGRLYGKYAGNGDRIRIVNVNIIGYGRKKVQNELPQSINMVDVGAAFGIHHQFEKYVGGHSLSLTMFEPFLDEANKLRLKYPDANLLEVALSDYNGTAILNETEHPGCSSIRLPNKIFLEQFNCASWFKVVNSHEIPVARYDTLFADGKVPVPDYLKIDVQGLEYEVLRGFGDLLDQILVVELEASFYEVYIGQKLFHELIDLLARHGLMLHMNLHATLHNFGNIYVEASSAYFIRTHVDANKIGTLNTIKRLLGLT